MKKNIDSLKENLIENNNSSPGVDFGKKESFLKRWFAPLKSKKPRTDNKFFGFLQRLGGTFMLPIAVMAVAGVLMGFGSGIGGLLETESGGWYFFDFLTKSGSFFFDLMPLSFAIAIPVGMVSNNQGSAALAAVFAYVGTLVGMNFIVTLLENKAPSVFSTLFSPGGIPADEIGLLKSRLGINNVMDLSVIGSIIIGLTIWQLNERLQYKKLPTFLAFISAKRLTPTLAIIIFPIYGLIITFIWPWFGLALFYVGKGLQGLGDFGPALYAFMQCILRPTGLHHMTSSLIGYTSVGGHWEVYDEFGQLIAAVEGTTTGWRAFAGAGQLVPHNLARWLSGANSVYMFWSLPAAAIAIYLCSKKDQKPIVKATIISIIVTSIFGGVTEPIEFLFLFVAPWLYVFHAFMTGLSFLFFGLMDVRIAYGGDIWGWFTWGPIWGLQTKWYLGLLISPLFSIVYFIVFYFSIKKFDLKTIGRTDVENVKTSQMVANIMGGSTTLNNKKIKKEAKELLLAESCLELLGGWDNIESLTNCYSRLRVVLKEAREITDQQVKNLGASGLKTLSSTAYQIIIGIQVEVVRHYMEKMRGKTND